MGIELIFFSKIVDQTQKGQTMKTCLILKCQKTRVNTFTP